MIIKKIGMLATQKCWDRYQDNMNQDDVYLFYDSIATT